MKKLAYLIACSLVIAGFFVVPTASAIPACTGTIGYNIETKMRDDATAHGKSFDPAVNSYIISEYNGSLRATYATNGDRFEIQNSGVGALQWTTGSSTYRVTNITIDVWDSTASSSDFNYTTGYGTCVYYAGNIYINPTYTGGNTYNVLPSQVVTPPSSGTHTASDALTEAQADGLLNKYATPIYKVLGGVSALAVVYAAYYFVLRPFVRRFR